MYFSPSSGGIISYHSQDRQHGGCVPHKPSGRFTVAHPGQDLLLWSQYKFLSLRAVHVPGILNLAADFLSRQKLRPGEWMLNRQTVSQIWDLFGEAAVDLFASQESSHCPLWFSLSFPTTLGIDAFAHPWPNVSLCAFPPIKLIPAVLGSTIQSEGERCPSPSHSPILALPDLVLGANPPLVPVSLGDSGQAGLAVPASGQDLASSTRALEVVGMAHTGPRAVMNVLPVEVQETIASARAPATRKLYTSKWGVLNPGVWLVQLTQLTALLVQCWSFCKKS